MGDKPLRTPEQEYILGLEDMRRRISELEEDVNECETDNSTYISDAGWTEAEYKFMSCIRFLESKNLKIEKIESEIGMVSLINDLHATGADQELISFVSSYWDKFHFIMQVLRQLMERFQIQVNCKLTSMLSNQLVIPTSSIELAQQYNLDIGRTLTSMDRLYHRLSSLCLSYQTKVEREHMEKGACESLPIIYLPRDLLLKLKRLVRLSHDCLNRDERFVADMTCAMLERRKQKREYEAKLNQQKEMRLDKIKNANLANLLLQKNQELLDQLDKELDEIEAQMANKENALTSTILEKERDDNAIEFLNHAITSTKRNQSLLIKRQRLSKTKESLEKKLSEIETDLKTMAVTKEEKASKKQEIKENIEVHQTSYIEIKEQLDQYSEEIFEAEKEVKDIHSQLIDIEILHCIKTSPENIDDVRDRPQSVKIARSLREKITNRRLRKRTN